MNRINQFKTIRILLILALMPACLLSAVEDFEHLVAYQPVEEL